MTEKTELIQDESFYEEGAIGMEVIGGLIGLALGAFLFMLVAVIGGKTFASLEDDITAIPNTSADLNAIESNILAASRSTFVTIRDLTDLLPIFGFLFVFGALAVIVSNLGNVVGGGGGMRSAL